MGEKELSTHALKTDFTNSSKERRKKVLTEFLKHVYAFSTVPYFGLNLLFVFRKSHMNFDFC